jgi:hypothetical protein
MGFSLTPTEVQTLRVEHKATKDKWAADRIVVALGTGLTLE